MFGFNRAQAQAVLDTQRETLAAINNLALIVNFLAQDNPINKAAVEEITEEIQRVMDKREAVLVGVFS